MGGKLWFDSVEGRGLRFTSVALKPGATSGTLDTKKRMLRVLRKIIKKLIPTSLFKRVEPFGHLIEAIAANVYYGFPSRGMHVIGVTGTNGKLPPAL